MSQAKNIEGQKFGSLTILHEYGVLLPSSYKEPGTKRRVQYRCDCGIVACTYKGKITAGYQTHCPHCINNKVEWGKKYGRLTALSRDLIHTRRYRCRCDCGTEDVFSLKVIFKPEPKCKNCKSLDPDRKIFPTREMQENSSHICNLMPKLIGKKFGCLIVLRFAFFYKYRRSTGYIPYYHAVCVCGRNIEISYANLKHAKSCGCKRKFRNGEDTFSSKFKEKEIVTIRHLAQTGMYDTVQLAKMYGMSRKYLYKVITRDVWKHVN